MFPVNSFETEVARPHQGRLPWFALQVRTRHEMTIAGFLEAKGYEPFVPLYKSRKRWSDRVKLIEAPLFPGYLFCRLDPQFRLPVLKTPGVIQIVGQNRVPVSIEESEIQAIQAVVASGFQAEPWPFLTVGDRVRIGSGCLRGMDGIVVKMKENYRLVVSVTLLRRSVAVEIDSSLVEPAATAPAGLQSGLQVTSSDSAAGKRSNLFESPGLAKSPA